MALGVEEVIRVVTALWDMDQNKNADGLVMMVVWLAAAAVAVEAAAVHMVGLVAPEVRVAREAPKMTGAIMLIAIHMWKVLEAQVGQQDLLMGGLQQNLLIMVPVAPALVAAAEDPFVTATEAPTPVTQPVVVAVQAAVQ